MIGFYIVVIIICVIVAIVAFIAIDAQESGKAQVEMKKRDAVIKAQKDIEEKTPIYNAAKNNLIAKYGEPDRCITIEALDINKEIMAFGKVNRVFILGKDLPMSDVLSCSFNDSPQVIKGKITAETKTSTGSITKRAIAGDILLGGAGAIIGGSTAKKNIVYKQENDEVNHNYTVLININSLSEPIIRINLGSNGTMVNEIVGLMNVIISRNK